MEELELSPMAQRVESRMRELGFATPAALAKEANISRAVMTNIRRRPEKQLWISVAMRLAKALKCRVEWLVEGTGPVTDNASEDFERLYGKSPMVELEELGALGLDTFILSSFEDDKRMIYHCPVAASERTVAIKTGRKLGRFDDDTIIFMDLEKRTPNSGQIVLARQAGGGTPEFYTYSTSMNKKFIKAMTEDLPEELKFIEVTEDIEIIGTFVSAIVA